MPSPQIRPVMPADAAAWEEMRSAMWPDGSDDHAAEIASFFAGNLPEPDAVMIAKTEDHKSIAILELSIRRDIPGFEGEPVGYIEGLYIKPAATASPDGCSRNRATGRANRTASASPATGPDASALTRAFPETSRFALHPMK